MHSNVSHTRKRGSRCDNNLMKLLSIIPFRRWVVKPYLLPHIINWKVMRNFCLTVSFSHRRMEAHGMKGGTRFACVINKDLPAPVPCLFWSLKCSWHIFYKSQPCFLPVANCMHISAPCDQPPFLSHPSPVSPPPLLMRTSWLIIKVIFYLQGKAVAGMAGAPQLRSVFLWRITCALMTISCCFRLETEEWFWWLEINSRVYSL